MILILTPYFLLDNSFLSLLGQQRHIMKMMKKILRRAGEKRKGYYTLSLTDNFKIVKRFFNISIEY